MASGDQGDMEILSNQINEIVIRDDGPIQHFETVHVPEHRDITQAEALFTPSKPISNTSAGSTDISVHAKSSSDAVLFSTPQSYVKECCKDSTCSVCLSPLLCRTALVETRCKHTFHEKCLRLAKGQKAECPNCRASLTPLQSAKNDVEPTIDYSGGYRAAIIARSASARNAVRQAIMRRESERQREISEAKEGNKENM